MAFDRSHLIAAIVAATCGLLSHASIENPSILPTPPMGFNNWNRFECDLNQTLFMETADAMASNGLREAGYDRVNLDDCWMAYTRAANGSLQWNATKFPNGLPWLAQYVEARGFKLGIYEDAGNMTCGGYPGSYGYEKLDADTFHSWGVDYLKLDGCNVDPANGRTLLEEYKYRYALWHEILDGMQSPLVFSESAPAYFVDSGNSTDWYSVMDWVPVYGELARHSTDILIYGGSGSSWDSIMVNYDFNTLLARYQAPGYYNDPDFLIPDHPDLTMDEKRSHFALWASFSAPLIISAWIPGLSNDVISFLTNEDLISVNQDKLAQQATLVSRDNISDVLTRSLENGDRVLTVLNRGNSTASVTISAARLGLVHGCSYMARSLWDGLLTSFDSRVDVRNLPSHATAVYRISLPRNCSSVTPTGMIFNTASKNCLSASPSNNITFKACNGDDSQVWRVQSDGSISPLSDATKCLAAQKESLNLSLCGGSQDQKWSYHVSGNLRNGDACLTEGSIGSKGCGFEIDTQVWALPSGVYVNRTGVE